MSNEVAVAVIGGFIALAKWLSTHEHRGNRKDFNDIKVYFNGELERRLKEAREEGREEGRQEERNKGKKKNL